MEIKLFDSELKVMDILWKEGDTSAKDIAEKLNKQLRRFRTPAEYERIQAEILASCPIRSNVQGDLI